MKTQISKILVRKAWNDLAKHFADKYPLCETATVRIPDSNSIVTEKMFLTYKKKRWFFPWDMKPSIFIPGGFEVCDQEPLKQAHFMAHITILEEAIKKVDSAPHQVIDLIEKKIQSDRSKPTGATASRAITHEAEENGVAN